MSAYIIGVSGGIGSGKSTVAESFSRHGAAVVDTDRIAHALTAAGGKAIPAIRVAFGDEVIDIEGALDRGAMRQRVFADPGQRRKLENILHPLIREESHRQCIEAETPYVLLLIPLLVETMKHSPYRFLDRILVIDCDEETQVARVVSRNGLSENEVRNIMATQASRAARRTIADDVLENDGERSDLDAQIDAMHQKYLGLANLKLKASC